MPRDGKRGPRNYGPRGCLLTVASVAALVIFFEVFYGMLDIWSPDQAQIQSAANDLVRRQLADEPITALTVAVIHSRKKRFSLTTDRWAVEGEVIVRDAETEERSRKPYVAVLHTICGDHLDLSCWVLEQLTYGDQIIRLRESPGSVIN